MNCREAKQRIGLRRDGELDDAEARAVEEHLAGCADCQAHEGALRQMGGALQQSFPAAAPPDDLAARAFRAAMTAEPQAVSFLERLFPIAWPSAVAGSMAAAALMVVSLSAPASSQTPSEALDQVVGISSTPQVHTILQGALGVSIDVSTGVSP